MKIDQKQFTIIFGCFNIIGELNLKMIKFADDTSRVTSLKRAFDSECLRFKALLAELTDEQRNSIDGIEFGLTGYSFESYSAFADSIVVPVVEEVIEVEYLDDYQPDYSM